MKYLIHISIDSLKRFSISDHTLFDAKFNQQEIGTDNIVTYISPNSRLFSTMIRYYCMVDRDMLYEKHRKNVDNVCSKYYIYYTLYNQSESNFDAYPDRIPYVHNMYDFMENQNKVLDIIQHETGDESIRLLIEYQKLLNKVIHLHIWNHAIDNFIPDVFSCYEDIYLNNENMIWYINLRLNRLLELYLKELKKQCNII